MRCHKCSCMHSSDIYDIRRRACAQARSLRTKGILARRPCLCSTQPSFAHGFYRLESCAACKHAVCHPKLRVTQPCGGPACDLRFCTCLKSCMCVAYQIRAKYVRTCGWVGHGAMGVVHVKQMAGLTPHHDPGLHQPAQPKAAWTAPA